MTRSQRIRGQQRRMSESAETHKETEAQKIYGWRIRVLKEAGMPPELAMRVADSTMDLHRAVKMLQNGCSSELLVEIAL